MNQQTKSLIDSQVWKIVTPFLVLLFGIIVSMNRADMSEFHTQMNQLIQLQRQMQIHDARYDERYTRLEQQQSLIIPTVKGNSKDIARHEYEINEIQKKIGP